MKFRPVGLKRILRCEKNPKPERSDWIVSTPEGQNFHIGVEVWFGWFSDEGKD